MKKFLGLLFTLLAVSLPARVLALEIDFPSVAGIKPSDSFGPGDWIQYIFIFGLSLVGLAIIYTVVYAGITWLTAGDNSGKITDAKKRLWEGLIGLLILLGSYILLNTINPDLVTLKQNMIQVQIGKSNGVLQLKEDGQTCYSSMECKSQKCDQTASNMYAAGKCVGSNSTLPLRSRTIGQSCTDNSDCTSRYCYASPGSSNLVCQQVPQQ